jgi:DNA-directed RNA polymerase
MTYSVDLSKLKDPDVYAAAVERYGEDLMSRQVELERWSNERGEIKFTRNAQEMASKGRIHEHSTGRCAVEAYYGPFREALEWQLERSGRGARAAWKNLLDRNGHVDAADVALIALRSILSMVARGDRSEQQQVARFVMDNIKTEITTREFQQQTPLAIKDYMQKAQRKQMSIKQIKTDVKAIMASREVSYTPPGFENSGNVIAAGVALMQILMQACPGVIEFSNPTYDGRKSYIYVHIGAELQQLLDEKIMSVASVSFAAMPLLVPPVEWSTSNLAMGGFYSTYIRNYPLVKKTRKLYSIEVQNTAKIGQVTSAVNAMQNTGWKINHKVLSVFKWLFNHKEQLVSGFARADIPEAPRWDEEYWEANKQECKKILFQHHEEERSMKSVRLQYLTLLEAAEMFAQEEAFYFAWDLDSRGRAYPITSNLSPQGSDWTKHLMHFAKGQVIEKDSDMDGIRFAVANAMGHDKLPIAERIQWTKDNLAELIAVGQDPQSHLLWTDAEEPAAFLAGCIELAEYAEQGVGFISRMPVAVDATCSGLQGLSALSRDEVGGKMVNLTSEDERFDIYAAVAEGPFRRKLEECARGDLGAYADVEKAQEFAKAALEFGFDRKLTKRPVMTVPYAAQEDSCRRYVREYYHDRMKKEGAPHEQFVKFSTFMAKILWDSIPEVIVKGLEVMKWLQEVSVIAVRANPNVPLQWDTPDGFVGRTNRPKERFIQPQLYIYDYKSRGAKALEKAGMDHTSLRTRQWTDVEDPKQHKNSCAPNFVHSLDAAQLRAVVRRWTRICAVRGTSPEFAMIHDSFAVGTRDFYEFNTVIREEFVKLYEECDPLAEYELAMREIAGPDAVFPPRPTMGSLDIRETLNSEYFFS